MVEDFLDYIVSTKGHSEETRKSYSNDLKLLIDYIKKLKGITEGEIDYANITLANLHSFMSQRTKEGDAPSTRARRTASIKSFFKYLKRMEIIQYNIAQDLESPEKPKVLPKSLNLKESEKLLRAVNGMYKERDYAILCVFLYCGLRLSELMKINVDSINGDILLVIGKGEKEREVPMTKEVLDSVSKYMKVRQPKNPYDNALFISERGGRMCRSSIQKTVKKYLGKIGLADKFSTHSLRHTNATLLYNEGHVDIRTIQELLGHEDISTTQIYAEVTKDTKRNAVNRNPLHLNALKNKNK